MNHGDPCRQLATDLAEAMERFHANAEAQRCARGCTCPLETVLASIERYIGAVEGFDAGELLPLEDGLPIDAPHGESKEPPPR